MEEPLFPIADVLVFTAVFGLFGAIIWTIGADIGQRILDWIDRPDPDECLACQCSKCRKRERRLIARIKRLENPDAEG